MHSVGIAREVRGSRPQTLILSENLFYISIIAQIVKYFDI